MSPVSGPEQFFVEELQKIERFLVDTDSVMLRIVVDPEMRRMPLNYLSSREEAADFPHLLLSFTEPFASPFLWFDDLLNMFDAAIAEEEETLQQIGADLSDPEDGATTVPSIWATFLARAEKVTDSLPDHIGALVFVFEPESVEDPQNWVKAMEFLADRTGSQWLKFLVLEPRLTPQLEALKDHPKVKTQVFWLAPEEIERRAEAIVLASDRERR